MKKARIIKLVKIILVFVFVFSALNIAKIFYDYSKADNTYEAIQNDYVTFNEQVVSRDQSENGDPEQIKASEIPITVDFDALLERNGDVTGWLYCPETAVNYPIVQGQSNDQYLHRDIDGNHLKSGTLFVDYRNGTLGTDANYIIYGHNMKNGSMFNALAKYKKQAYYDSHPIMYYLTPEGNYRLELFAGRVVKRDDEIYTFNQSNEELQGLLDEYKSKSTFESAVEPGPDDIIITLSTCSYEFDNARYIVIGRLVRL